MRNDGSSIQLIIIPEHRRLQLEKACKDLMHALVETSTEVAEEKNLDYFQHRIHMDELFVWTLRELCECHFNVIQRSAAELARGG